MPMSVPVAKRSRRPADRVLDVAEDLFHTQGVDATGVDAIVAQSGVSKSTLYRHFPSKADLVAAYLRRGHERRLGEWVAEIRDRDVPPAQRILDLFDWLGDWFATPAFGGCRFINAAVQLRDPTHPAFAIPGEHKEEVRRLLADAAAQAGAIASDELAAELSLLIDGAVIRALLERDSSAAQRARRLAVLTLADHGVTVQPAARSRGRGRRAAAPARRAA